MDSYNDEKKEKLKENTEGKIEDIQDNSTEDSYVVHEPEQKDISQEHNINENQINPKDKNDFRNMNFKQIIKRVAILTVVGVIIFTSFYKAINTLGWCFESNRPIVNREEAYRFVHEMTNNVILAKDGKKWGSIDINNKNIERAIEYFSSIDSTVVEHLNKWQDGDFDNSVNFHNYVWDQLRGNVGEAIAVDHVGIDIARFNLGH